MNRKTWIYIAIGFVVLLAGVLIYITVINNSNASEDSLDEIKTEKEDREKEVESQTTDIKKEKNHKDKSYLSKGDGEEYKDVMSKEDMEQVVIEYEREFEIDPTDEDYEDKMISKISDNHGFLNTRAYSEGLLIGQETSEEDARDITIELYTQGKPINIISNPIERGVEKNQTKEIRSIFRERDEGREYRIELMNEGLDTIDPLYYKDTEGFIELGNGVSVGYFSTVGKSGYIEEVGQVGIYMWFYIDEDIKIKDFIKELDKHDLNGSSLAGQLKGRVEHEDYEVESTLFEGSVMDTVVDVQLEDIVKGYKLGEGGGVSNYTREAKELPNPIITLDGEDIELDEATVETLENDIKIKR